jgi:prefoldin subunit 5
MTAESDFVHKLCEERMNGADFPTLKADNDALKAENSTLQTALSKAQDRIKQLEALVAEHQPAAALKEKPEPPPK